MRRGLSCARLRLLAAAGLAATGGVAAFAAASAAKGTPSRSKPHLCAGTARHPGVLAGTYRSNVVVKGICKVEYGPAHVLGTLMLTRGSVLLAAYGRDDKTDRGSSTLTVRRDIQVGRGATLQLGCRVLPNGAGLPCDDEPNMKHPTLSSHPRVGGSIIADSALGVVIHDATIGGSFKDTGGGGGARCVPEGPFEAFKVPVYSDVEDTSIGGSVAVKRLVSCWLGFARVRIHGSATFTANTLADPDAIEIIANHIGGNLSCTANAHPPGSPPIAEPVWDSADVKQGTIFPRAPEPNKVGGKRSGQCKLASPTAPGGALGPGPF
jgi:hypothetical protein